MSHAAGWKSPRGEVRREVEEEAETHTMAPQAKQVNGCGVLGDVAEWHAPADAPTCD